jgi:hypothetical protein
MEPEKGHIRMNGYPLVMTNIATENCPFIDGLPFLKMVIFHGYVSHSQMVMSTSLLERIPDKLGD